MMVGQSLLIGELDYTIPFKLFGGSSTKSTMHFFVVTVSRMSCRDRTIRAFERPRLLADDKQK